MAEVETGRFTVGVFKDAASAERGIDALKRQGFSAEALTMMAKDGPETSACFRRSSAGFRGRSRCTASG